MDIDNDNLANPIEQGSGTAMSHVSAGICFVTLLNVVARNDSALQILSSDTDGCALSCWLMFSSFGLTFFYGYQSVLPSFRIKPPT